MGVFLKPKNPLLDFIKDKYVVIIEPAINYKISIKQFLANLKVNNVIIVNNTSEVKKELLIKKPGFFIVEWNLEEENGLQYCRQLRKLEKYKEVPFLLTSVENLKQDVILASEVGVDGYLLKPFSYEDFCAQIFNIINNYSKPSILNTLLDNGDKLFYDNKLDQAQEFYIQALKINAKSARANTGLARIAFVKGTPSLAMKYLKEAIDNNPQYIKSYREMLKISDANGDLINLLQTAQQIHQMSPENPKYTLILAKTYLELGNIEESEKFFKKTIQLSPKLAEGYKGMGNVYLLKKEYELAMKNLRKALDLDSEDISTLNSLGLAYIRIGNPKKALNKFVIALQLEPENSKILFNMGCVYERLNNVVKAEWYFRQAVNHDEGFDKAKKALERLLKNSANSEGDEEVFLEAG